MGYTSIELLPHSVKAAIPEPKDQLNWLKVFNQSFKQSKEFQKAAFDAWQSLNGTSGVRHFEGWLSTDYKDVQGDVMEQTALHKSLMKHVSRGGVMVEVHTNRTLGSLYGVELRKYDETHMGNYGWGVIYQGEPLFDEVWGEIKKGEKNGFSIGGFAINFRTECNAEGCHRLVTEPSIHEMSVCRKPAEGHSKMTDINRLAKGEDSITIPKGHLRKDKAKLSEVRDIIDELLDDDEDEDGLEKAGNSSGACKGHRRKGQKMSTRCEGKGTPEDSEDVEKAKNILQVGVQNGSNILEEKEDMAEKGEADQDDLDKEQRESRRRLKRMEREEEAEARPKRGEPEDEEIPVPRGVGTKAIPKDIRVVNNRRSQKLAYYIRDQIPSNFKSADHEKAYNRVVESLGQNNGLPIKERLTKLVEESKGKSPCYTKTINHFVLKVKKELAK